MTRFYGVDAYRSSPAALASMEACRPALEAEEQLKSGKVADRDVYDVALVAFGCPKIASRCLAARIRARQERGERTEVYR